MQYWTKEQAEQFADQNAKELSNRLIFLQGSGEPNQKAPIGSIYQDNSQTPVIWYRKIGTENGDWQSIVTISTEKASTEQIENGVNDENFITPFQLSTQIDQLKQEVLSYPSEIENIDLVDKEVTLSTAIDPIDQSVVVTLPETSQNQLSILIEGYEEGSTLSKIVGGNISQIITLRKKETALLALSGTSTIRLAGDFQFKDIDQLDNITLQKINATTWIEIARKSFTNT